VQRRLTDKNIRISEAVSCRNVVHTQTFRLSFALHYNKLHIFEAGACYAAESNEPNELAGGGVFFEALHRKNFICK